MLKIGVVGCGNWGRNIIRTLGQLPGCRVAGFCDQNPALLETIRARFPGEFFTTEYSALVHRPGLDALVIATTSPAHYAMAREALLQGKLVYVEKPMTVAFQDALELQKLDPDGTRLMVGHLLMYHPAVLYVKDLIDRGELGRIYCISAERLNLGLVRSNENAWWSLAPHDISACLLWLNEQPQTVWGQGQCFLRPGVEDIVFSHLRFPSGAIAQIHASWLDPNKVRRMTVVGSKKMVVLDDMEPVNKVRVFDKGADRRLEFNDYGEFITLRNGDIEIPRVDQGEPLVAEMGHFVACARDQRPFRSGVRQGAEVVRVLDAVQRSIQGNGQPVVIS